MSGIVRNFMSTCQQDCQLICCLFTFLENGKGEIRGVYDGLDVADRTPKCLRYKEAVFWKVNGLVALMESEHIGPFNLGNLGEFTILEHAEVVKETIDSSATIEFKPNTANDPHMRKPDISKAKELLNWKPKIPLREGLPLVVNDFRNRILNQDEGKGL